MKLKERNPLCIACGREWHKGNRGSGILATTLTDEPGNGLHIIAGCPRIVISYLCGDCIQLRSRNDLLRYVPVSEGQPISVLGTKDSTAFLDRTALASQLVEPPTWFEGRAASLAEYCKDQSGLKRFCERIERFGLRTVGGYSSESDRRAVYHFGLMFGQEAPSGPPNVFVHPRLIGLTQVAYLIKSRDGTEYLGAVSFETVRHNTLVWVWLRPDARRKGILSHYWPIFESAHRNFRVLTPLSEGMKSFLRGHPGHDLTETT